MGIVAAEILDGAVVLRHVLGNRISACLNWARYFSRRQGKCGGRGQHQAEGIVRFGLAVDKGAGIVSLCDRIVSASTA
jgi:hypothetical protein